MDGVADATPDSAVLKRHKHAILLYFEGAPTLSLRALRKSASEEALQSKFWNYEAVENGLAILWLSDVAATKENKEARSYHLANCHSSQRSP
jgi:hypothetical protein